MEPLNDPLGDRVVTSVKPPPHIPLEHNLLFSSGNPNWAALKNHLYKEGRINKSDLLLIVDMATRSFRQEPNLLQLNDPITIVGDVHGQFYDLVKLLEIGGSLENRKYLFLGDYVDRGAFSVECVLLLYALKLNYPQQIFLLRGNHECRQMTTFFNFRSECLHKYDLEVYERIMESFDCMPLACVVNKKFIALHGGISPELRTLEDINRIQRTCEPPRQGIYCDILWSDPVDSADGRLSETYKVNDVRGCSVFYGAEAVSRFLKRNDLISVIRAHEAQLDGYKMHKWKGNKEFPMVITIFSAPNYCDVYNNKGAIIKFDNNTLNIQQFNYTNHPYLLPNFLDVFSWSTPFVIEKTLEMLYCLLKPDPGETKGPKISEEGMNQLKLEAREAKKTQLRNKIKAVSRMVSMFKTLRKENEIVVQLKGLCPDNKIPRGLLSEGRSALESAVESFEKAKKVDIVNEKRPN